MKAGKYVIGKVDETHQVFETEEEALEWASEQPLQPSRGQEWMLARVVDHGIVAQKTYLKCVRSEKHEA